MPDALIVADIDFDEFLADEIAADDQYDRYLIDQENADRLAGWESALRLKSFAPAARVTARAARAYRRPRERRARRVVRTSGSRGDPSEPEPPLGHPRLTRAERDYLKAELDKRRRAPLAADRITLRHLFAVEGA
jgi:hypothetical protein